MATTKQVHDVYRSEERYRNLYSRFKMEKSLKTLDGIVKLRPGNVKIALEYLDMREKYLIDKFGHEEEAKVRYYKTLKKDLSYLRNILYWFNEWDLTKIGEQEIRQVYEGLEKGEVRTFKDKIVAPGSRKDYYRKYMKNGFFEHLGKHEIAREVIIREIKDEEDVRYFELEDLENMVLHTPSIHHKALLWLLFDSGIEIKAVLSLKRSNFREESDSETQQDYYVVNVPLSISKKNRAKRHIMLMFQETNELMREVFSDMEDEARIFDFSYRNALQVVHRASEKAGVKVKPSNERVSIKDFRSSCATHYLTKEKWTTDEIKARLGHKPSSDVIDRYVSYFGLNQKRKLQDKAKHDMEYYKMEFEKSQRSIRKNQEDMAEMEKKLQMWEDRFEMLLKKFNIKEASP